MQNARLDEAQAGINISRRNINNFRYADDTTLMVERGEELKSLLMKVREWKSWLKTQHSKNKDYGIQSHHSTGSRWGNNRNFIFLGSKITADGDCSHEIKRCLLLGRKASTNLDSILKSRDITLPTKFCVVKDSFPSCHVRMWELEHKESSTKKLMLLNCSAGKNSWKFLDCREIKAVNLIGNQP